MNFIVHWLIKSIGYKPSDESVVLSVAQIVELVEKMGDDDVIYTYHTEKQLDRIALYGTSTDEIVVSIQGHGGSFDKNFSISDIKTVLDSFEDIQVKSEEYGFQPDWD
jgi:hypothetical protein